MLLFLNVSPNFQSSELVTVSFGGPSVAPSPTNIYQQDGIEIEISESSNVSVEYYLVNGVLR